MGLARWQQAPTLLASEFYLCFFADDVIFLASSRGGLQLALEQLTAECEVAGMKISTSKSVAMIVNQQRVECHPRSEKSCYHKWRSGGISDSCSRVRGEIK